MMYWKRIVQSVGHPLACLINVAAMMLALPAGESHDDFVFSASGRIYSKDRNSLSGATLEQMTVIVMYIKNFGWSQTKMEQWIKEAVRLSQSH